MVKEGVTIVTAMKLLPWTFFIPFIIWATSPLPPPYHQYVVFGHVPRPSGGSKNDFTVVLMGKTLISGDPTYSRLRGISYASDVAVSLTDTAGLFFLRVSSILKADSVRAAVIIADSLPITGTPISTAGLQVLPLYETYTPTRSTGCACATEPAEETRTVGYQYLFPEQTVILPF